MTTTVVKTIGVGGDYTVLQTWEDAAPADLTVADEIWQGQIKSATDVFADTSGTTPLVISGSTTDATRYKELTCATGASFADNASVQSNALRYNTSNGAAISENNGYHTAVIKVAEQYVRLTRLQLFAGSTGSQAPLQIEEKHCRVDRCILESQSAYSLGVFAGTGGFGCGDFFLLNCLVVDRVGGRTNLGTLTLFSNLPLTFVNCTFVVPSDLTANTNLLALQYAASSTVLIENCAFFGITGAVFSGTVTPTFTTCVTNGTTATGLTSLAYDTSTGSGFQATLDASRDFRIKSGSAMVDAGTTDATYTATDIAGSARPQGSAYDIGCWELFVNVVPVFGSLGDFDTQLRIEAWF